MWSAMAAGPMLGLLERTVAAEALASYRTSCSKRNVSIGCKLGKVLPY